MSGVLTLAQMQALAPPNGGNDASVVLLAHFEGANGATAFANSAASGPAMTALGNAQISTAQFKYGGSALFLDGSGDAVSMVSSTALDLTADFTIDFWARWNSVAGNQEILCFNQNASFMCAQRLSLASGVLKFLSSANGTSQNISDTVVHSPSTGVWYHYSVNRSGNTYWISVNGAQVATFTNSGLPITTSAADLIGAIDNSGPVNSFNGWIEEFRVTKGVARWTANFTPPARPYT